MKKILFLLSIILTVLMGCQKDEVVEPDIVDDFKGTWICKSYEREYKWVYDEKLRDDFESGSFDKWNTVTNWVIDNSTSSQGDYSAKSESYVGEIFYSTKWHLSEMPITFWRKMESPTDTLQFVYNGTIIEWSGSCDWTMETIKVNDQPSNPYDNFKWKYMSTDGCVWIDDVNIPLESIIKDYHDTLYVDTDYHVYIDDVSIFLHLEDIYITKSLKIDTCVFFIMDGNRFDIHEENSELIIDVNGDVEHGLEEYTEYNYSCWKFRR